MVQIKNKTIADYNRGEITLKEVAQQAYSKLLNKTVINEVKKIF